MTILDRPPPPAAHRTPTADVSPGRILMLEELGRTVSQILALAFLGFVLCLVAGVLSPPIVLVAGLWKGDCGLVNFGVVGVCALLAISAAPRCLITSSATAESSLPVPPSRSSRGTRVKLVEQAEGVLIFDHGVDLGRCPVCAENLVPDQPVVACPGCGTLYHQDCSAFAERCAIYGCGSLVHPPAAAYEPPHFGNPSSCTGGARKLLELLWR